MLRVVLHPRNQKLKLHFTTDCVGQSFVFLIAIAFLIEHKVKAQ